VTKLCHITAYPPEVTVPYDSSVNVEVTVRNTGDEPFAPCVQIINWENRLYTYAYAPELNPGEEATVTLNIDASRTYFPSPGRYLMFFWAGKWARDVLDGKHFHVYIVEEGQPEVVKRKIIEPPPVMFPSKVTVEAYVDGEPVPATVVVAGISYTAPVTVELTPGTYIISASYGEFSESKTVTVESGESKTVEFRWVRLAPPPKEEEEEKPSPPPPVPPPPVPPKAPPVDISGLMLLGLVLLMAKGE